MRLPSRELAQANNLDIPKIAKDKNCDSYEAFTGKRRPRVAFILTEFPKTTETFIMRDVMAFANAGIEVRIFHLQPFNSKDVIHDFARPALHWAVRYPYVLSVGVWLNALRYSVKRPSAVAGIIRDILAGANRDPIMLLKALFILPASLRVARALRDWDADHTHASYAGHPATTAWIAKRVEGIPFSVSSHAHDLFESQALLACKLPEATFVRTISEFNKAFILKHVPALEPRPPVVIHVGVRLSPPTQRPLRDPGALRVLYVGSLEQRKGVDTLLKAFAQAAGPAWHLDILGDGPERTALESLAKRLGLGGRAVFCGAQQNTAVVEAMTAADVLVVPSRIGARGQTEGLPTVIVEALSTELPVIASRLTGIPEIVRHEETGLLIEVDDVDGLAKALRQVNREPEAARRWAQAGRQLVEQEFDQNHSATALLRLVLQAGPRRR